MQTADELRTRAAELEARVPPAIAGPRTDDERMLLEKAAALRADADQLDHSDDECVDADGDAYPEHDYPPVGHGYECRRCGAEADDGDGG